MSANKDLETGSKPSAVKPVEFDTEDLMVEDYNNPHLNTYVDGPGSNLPDKFAPHMRTERSNCEVTLSFVPSVLNDKGIQNLCSRYGKVKKVGDKWRNSSGTGDNVVVEFASVADAENAIYTINNLCFEVNGKRMRAYFKPPRAQKYKQKMGDTDTEKSYEVNEAMKGKTFQKAEIPAEFNYPLGIPQPLLKPKEIDNWRTNILLENGSKFPTIINGSAIHRHSSDCIEKMENFASKSDGRFDEQTQHFVHSATNDFSTPKQCKNCENFTVKFCKGCKNSFCSMYCLKEYNRNKGGCNCVNSGTPGAVDKRPNRFSIGRGAKLISSRVTPQRSCSVSSTDSDTKSTESGGRKSRSALLKALIAKAQECDLPTKNSLVVITNVASYEIVYLRSFEPKDNERYLKYLNDVAEYAKTAPSLNRMPEKGDIILAEYEGSYHRASVDRIENGKAIVDVLELGCVVAIPIENLKTLRPDLRDVQRFVFKASLSGIEPQKMKTDKCLIYLYKLVKKSVPLKFIPQNTGSPSSDVQCELKVIVTNESVNEKLKALNSIKARNCVMIKDIPIKPFDIYATEAVVVDNSLVTKGIVTVAMPEDLSAMFNMHQRIQEYCKDEYKSPYTPRMNEICLAKCNDQWYRAKMEQSFGDMNPVMLFIDFALFRKVHVDNMRRMPSDFKFTLYSSFAEIGGLTETIDLNKMADVFLPMSTLSVAKVEFVDEKTDVPTIYFNIPLSVKENDVTPSSSEQEVGVTTRVVQPRRKFLEDMAKKFAARAEEV